MRNDPCPQCRWVSVTDVSGRRHLEMRWALPIGAPSSRSLARAA